MARSTDFMKPDPKPIYAGPDSAPPHQPVSIQEAHARRTARAVQGWLAGLRVLTPDGSAERHLPAPAAVTSGVNRPRELGGTGTSASAQPRPTQPTAATRGRVAFRRGERRYRHAAPLSRNHSTARTPKGTFDGCIIASANEQSRSTSSTIAASTTTRRTRTVIATRCGTRRRTRAVGAAARGRRPPRALLVGQAPGLVALDRLPIQTATCRHTPRQ